MNCPFCGDEFKQLKGVYKNHLLACKMNDGHIHVHGDVQNRVAVKEMMDAISETTGVGTPNQKLDRKEIVFHNRQRIGDILMFTCGVRDFKAAYPDVRVNVISTAGHIFDYNKNIDRTLLPTSENTVKIGPGKGTNQSNRIDWHFSNAYRISMEDTLGIRIPQGESRPDVYFTEEEYNAPRRFKFPYWVIVVNGEKGWGLKMYPFDRWQEFVNYNPGINFVQIGTKGDNPPRLAGENVIDLVGTTEDPQTGIREVMKLFLNAEGSIGLVSFHMHLSGALYKPAIVIAGAREPVSFTRYQGHQYLANDGCLPCATTIACWHCDTKTCLNKVNLVPRCIDMIEPVDISTALANYYRGGRLKRNEPSLKPKLKNVIKNIDPKTITKARGPEDNKTKYGLDFGGGCITRNDWEFMQSVIKKYKVKTVLEFGSGLSTLLMNDAGLKVITYETNQGWIDKLKKINPNMDIRFWDGKSLFETGINYKADGSPDLKFDMTFVDGPARNITLNLDRERSTELAANLSDVIIVHDANRENERKWQDKYIKNKFNGPGKGGNRCHLWIKKTGKPGTQAGERVQGPLPPGKKFIKVVSTAKGWGGCARSITTIMKMLLAQGHMVEFIPFRNSVGSREFQECIKKELHGLIVTLDYSTLKDPCDVLFVYADDYVWEFTKPQVADWFNGAKANKKIMMLNYRMGEVGKVEWTKGWDKYMFLNSTQERKLLERLPGVKTKVLPPCTDLSNFFEARPKFEGRIRLVRHSSQGDAKFEKAIELQIDELIKTKEDLLIDMMPGPSFVLETYRFRKWKRNSMPMCNFLETGNLFWYSLPYGYMDMGPRVIIEAMAAGLPIVADNWGGAVDRVTPECGWLFDTKEEQLEFIKKVPIEELEKKGAAARERARNEFDAKNWIKELLT